MLLIIDATSLWIVLSPKISFFLQNLSVIGLLPPHLSKRRQPLFKRRKYIFKRRQHYQASENMS